MGNLFADSQIPQHTLMKFFSLIYFVALSSIVFGQVSIDEKNVPKKALNLFEAAEPHIQLGEFEPALEKLLAAEKIAPDFLDALDYIGNIYMVYGDWENAEKYFSKLISYDENFDPDAHWGAGNACFYQQKYDAAVTYFTTYLEFDLTPKKMLEGKQFLNNSKFAATAMLNPVPYDPQNMGSNVNSFDDDYWPIVNAENNQLIYTRLIATERYPQEDFYQSNFIDASWTKARSIGSEVNTSDNEGAPTISADGRYLIFTGCERSDGYGSCDLYITLKSDGKWLTPHVISEPVNSRSFESQPCLSADGRALYFVSNRKGGFGGNDIWMTSLNEENVFAEPINLGPQINTEGNEGRPFIHADNQTLYFTSDMHPGMGGIDLFYSTIGETGEWTNAPVNLGYPINTENDERDIFIASDAKTAYIASDREGGFGGFDIYSFELYVEARPVFTTYVKGKVFDSETKIPLSSSVELIDLENGKTIYKLNSDFKSGEFLICIPVGKNYAYNVSKEGYLFYSENFSLKDYEPSEPYQLDIPLEKVADGEKVILKNIFFNTDQYELLSESKIELDKLITLLNNNPSMVIEIGGHTDNTGTKDHNQILSENRAKAVFNYLIDGGINSSRLSFKGYADSDPIKPNDTDDNKAENRRTEFKVISTD